MKLRLNQKTVDFLHQLEAEIPQAILLTGPVGSGLSTLARHIANQHGVLLDLVEPSLKTSASSLKSITVERVRELYVITRGKYDTPHFVIIDDADFMNTAAQNALLKLLEEPSGSIHFILTSHSSDRLLPTIRSRLQAFNVAPISEIDSRRLLQAHGVTDDLDERRLLFIAGGLPAELSRLALDTKTRTLLFESVQTARQFAEGDTYQRLVIAGSVKDDRQGALALIGLIVLLLRKSLDANPSQKTAKQLDNLLMAAELIQANGNVRLQLARAVV